MMVTNSQFADSLHDFLAAINEIPFLFANHADVMARYRDFVSADGKGDKLVPLLRSLAPYVDVKFNGLSDADITKILVPPHSRNR
jgi:hypothetical protein